MITTTRQVWQHIMQHHSDTQFTKRRNKSRFDPNEDLIRLVAQAENMALDFATISGTGELTAMISLQPNPHYRMMMLAKEMKLTKLLSFSDYYRDVDLPSTELPELVHEISRLERVAPAELRRFAADFKQLLKKAIVYDVPLWAIPH
ncbi:MAG: hypothetical protein ACEQSK_13405 [Sphingomonadaceae bacterium]